MRDLVTMMSGRTLTVKPIGRRASGANDLASRLERATKEAARHEGWIKVKVYSGMDDKASDGVINVDLIESVREMP